MCPNDVRVELSDFRTDADRYVEYARAENRVVVEAGGIALAHIVPPPTADSRGVPWGALAGQITIDDGFDEWPPEVLEAMINGPV